ncbi:hypothetical protein [Gracilimonas tropica]|uniref:hypothetical protein n=1 Tax=Gracilimonas tropica TaxID=454600 RepID=UPI000360BC57|nr:hypothetical protein [Gracilimonas tropica]
MKNYLHFVSLLFLLSSCASSGSYYDSYGYQENEPTLTKSLFPSDQRVISQAAIDTILASEIQLPRNAKIALINFPSENTQRSSVYGYGYWRSEDYLKLQQSYIDTLSSHLLETDFAESVIHLPSMLTPIEPTLPILREAAVRLQSPLMIVFRINSDIYEEFRFFRNNKAKAFSTIELVLLDVRTGLIPFTSIVTEEYMAEKLNSDSNFRETMKRAEREATLRSINKASNKLSAFFKNQK